MNGLMSTQIFWLAVTLCVFEGFDLLSRKSKRHPFMHPVLWATPAMIVILLGTHTNYATYLNATQVLGFLLGPAVVGLAVPIWARRKLIRQLALPLLAALVAGAFTAILTAVGVLRLFGAPQVLLATIAPRATTTPISMELAGQLGGIPGLAAAIVLLAGAIGAMTGGPIFNLMGIRDFRARGFAIGVSAHGFGAARAFQVNHTAGTFASLGMALNGVMTAALLSFLPMLV